MNEEIENFIRETEGKIKKIDTQILRLEARKAGYLERLANPERKLKRKKKQAEYYRNKSTKKEIVQDAPKKGFFETIFED